MEQATIDKMRETEEILLDVVRNAKQAAARPGMMKPVELEAAKILVDLFRIEKEIEGGKNE